MIKLEGKGACGGIAIGPIAVYQKSDTAVVKAFVRDPEAEIVRYHEAMEKAKDKLQVLYEKVLDEADENTAFLFKCHQMMIDAPDFVEGVEDIIRTQKTTAEYAVAVTGDNIAEVISVMDNDYMRERAADIKDATNCVMDILMEDGSFLGTIGSNMTEPSILLADDLAPSETAQLDRSLVLSFVTRSGSTTSHTSILARAYGIPSITGVDYPEDCDGKIAIVDGDSGNIYIDPDEETLAGYKKKKEEEEKKVGMLERLKGMENITKDGKKIEICANIGGVEDAASALENDAGGIGLFRSEYLYMESDTYPTEGKLFAVYKRIAKMMNGKKVIIRTLDIGADKQADYFGLDKEDNPALGYRAIRICLTREDIFRTQLRAVYRASHYGNISVMFPMIISVDEVKRCKAIAESVRGELDEQGIPYGDVETGIMIETPAAVMISDELAKEVDFFSVGTNDLTQYTLAIDRQNPSLDDFYDPHHPAILKMLRMVVESAHAEGIWVGICGELAADTSLTEEFLRMGFDELSVSPSMVLKVREAVRAVDLSRA